MNKTQQNIAIRMLWALVPFERMPEGIIEAFIQKYLEDKAVQGLSRTIMQNLEVIPQSPPAELDSITVIEQAIIRGFETNPEGIKTQMTAFVQLIRYDQSFWEAYFGMLLTNGEEPCPNWYPKLAHAV